MTAPLLTTSLYSPSLPAKIDPRLRLIEPMNEDFTHKLTSICAHNPNVIPSELG
jgi:hypothetical protein